ncbi:MAG: NADH-quinone oxidoreductase subunit J [Sedimentisphaerales bacterium]
MLEIFDKPWTLLGVAVLFLFGMLTFRSFFPEKRRWWQLLVPVFLIAAAFGADMLVQTDLEKINSVINTAIKAVQQEDCSAIEAVIANNYSDSYHSTKKHLLDHCRRELSKPLVDKGKETGLLIKISDSNATATLFAVIIFDKNSLISQNYKSFLLVKARLSLRKQPDKRWFINRIEILEIDRQPTNWNRIR